MSTPYEPFRDAIVHVRRRRADPVLIEHIAGGRRDRSSRRTRRTSAPCHHRRRRSRDQPAASLRGDHRPDASRLPRPACAVRPRRLPAGPIATCSWSGSRACATRARCVARYVPVDRCRRACGARRPGPAEPCRRSPTSRQGLSTDALSTLLEAAAGHGSVTMDERWRPTEEETDGTRCSQSSSCAISSRRACSLRTPRTMAYSGRPRTSRCRTVAGAAHPGRRLDPEAQRVLGMASVAGREFDSAVVASALELDESAVLDHLEAASRASLVERRTSAASSSPRAGAAALYDDLSATRRSLHHRQSVPKLETEGSRVACGPRHALASDRQRSSEGRRVGRPCGRHAIAAPSRRCDPLVPNRPRRARRRRPRGFSTQSPDRFGSAQRWADSDAFRQTLLDAALAERVGDDDALPARRSRTTAGRAVPALSTAAVSRSSNERSR